VQHFGVEADPPQSPSPEQPFLHVAAGAQIFCVEAWFGAQQASPRSV
jgi:hypothetical protein